VNAPFGNPCLTTHTWSEWLSGELAGVPYRHRWCDRCGDMQYDQTIAELTVLLDAAQVVNDVET
jgi:hypothetical protein